jgi:RNA polymerase-binding transcription factor DksA
MLTDDQLSHIRKRLLEERARALTDVNRSQSDAAQGEMESTGDLSAFTDNADQELAATLAEREIGEIAEIDAALERLYKHPKEFGRDERTGKDIPLARLDLIPWARTAS